MSRHQLGITMVVVSSVGRRVRTWTEMVIGLADRRPRFIDIGDAGPPVLRPDPRLPLPDDHLVPARSLIQPPPPQWPALHFQRSEAALVGHLGRVLHPVA